jgi:hypothetical protein
MSSAGRREGKRGSSRVRALLHRIQMASISNALQRMPPQSSDSSPEPATKSFTVCDTNTLPGVQAQRSAPQYVLLGLKFFRQSRTRRYAVRRVRIWSAEACTHAPRRVPCDDASQR